MKKEIKKELEEKLADLAHKQWSGWMQYLFSKCSKVYGGRGLAQYTAIPDTSVRRWKRQMTTDYKDLSEEEKESDRIEARKMIKLFEEFMDEYTKS